MDYNNLLNVPLRHQLDEDVIQSFFPFVESSNALHRQCRSCKSQLSSGAAKRDLRNHLLGHARVVEDKRIQNFERSQEAAGKLVCKCCRGEFNIPYAFRHAKACDDQKNVRYAKRRELRRKRQNENLLGKRLFDEADAFNHGENIKEETEDKTDKKMKPNSVFTSFSGREETSYNNQLYNFIMKYKHLDRRALKLKIKEFTEPLEEKWLADKTILQLEIYKLQRDQDVNRIERDKQIEELQAKIAVMEAEKEEMQKLIKDSVKDCETVIKQELQQEMEERIEQNTVSWRRELLELKSLFSKSYSLF